MDIKTFWRIVEDAKTASSGQCEAQAKALKERLIGLPMEEIIAFDRIFMGLHGQAYRWDLWGAAYVINGGCSDDGFCYFRAWLIGQGESIYGTALTDPDSLADAEIDPTEDAECEDLLYASLDAYKTKTGVEMPGGERLFPAPIGERWTEDDLEKIYPKLYARYESD